MAIKMIVDLHQDSPIERDRFFTEARAVARLEHPNIIAIHTIGDELGRPYLSLEFAEGGSLAQRLAGGPMSAIEAATLVETLALAIETAHRAGIIHRDLKPSNVLLTVEGVAKISDFGLAKLLDAETGRTLSGQPLGTPSFMSPEQAEGHSSKVGPRADVYSLGAILYQCLTGRPPFVGGSALETIDMVRSTEVVSPRSLRPDVARDLETICLKCLEKEPGKRYSTALELAEDLGRFLRDEPIRATDRNGAEQPQVGEAPSLANGLRGDRALRHLGDHRDELLEQYPATRRGRRTDAKAAEASRNAEEARRNYQEAGATIEALVKMVESPRLEGVPRLVELRHKQQEAALAFYERILSGLEANASGSEDSDVMMDTVRQLGLAAMHEWKLGHSDRAGQETGESCLS